MPTTYLDPQGTISNTWTLSGAATAHECLDDAVRDPTNAASSGDGAELNTTGSSQAAFLSMPDYTLAAGETVTQVKATMYAVSGNRRSVTIFLNDGTTQFASQVTTSHGQQWWTATYNGSLTQTQLNNLRIQINAGSVSEAGTIGTSRVYCAYIELTTTLSGVIRTQAIVII